MNRPTVPPTLDGIIAAIAARDAGRPSSPGQPMRWDTALALEVLRLRGLVMDGAA